MIGPMVDREGIVRGVLHLINKQGDEGITHQDEVTPSFNLNIDRVWSFNARTG